MLRVEVEINLTLTGPILTQSSTPGDFGYDMVVARNSKGLPYLPGTLIIGKLKQAWQELEDANAKMGWFNPDIYKWLGECSENEWPKTKQLLFSDFLLLEQICTINPQNRIRIDAERGAVTRHQQVCIESPFSIKKDYQFSGKLHFFCTQNDEAEKIIRHVKKGLQWTSQLGALRTIGFGRLNKVTCKPQQKEISKPITNSTLSLNDNHKIGLRIHPEYPFCISGSSLADNLFESQTIILGAAIIGTLATSWSFLAGKGEGQLVAITDADRIKLKKYFSKIRLTHAFPSTEANSRPVKAPYSLVKITKETAEVDDIYDVIQLNGPCLVENKAPIFCVDWKEDSDVNKAFGWASPKKELRIRTKIDPDLLRSAEQKLFAYEQVIPEDNIYWYAELDLSRICDEDRTDVFNELQSLISCGITGLGKTKTAVRLEFVNNNELYKKFSSDCEPINTNQWIITLQTDTLLGNPDELNECSGQQELRKFYEDAWADLSENKFKLVNYFARQRLSGGKYRQQVFQQADQPYRPWLLTEAGSVFLLESTPDNLTSAKEIIEKWLHHGLELGETTLKTYNISCDLENQWKTCPFIPQNGYGEIAVNLELHTNWKPENIQAILPVESKQEHQHD